MSKFIIEGGRRLFGECRVQGSKNSSLPILAACLLPDSSTVLHNCPVISDVNATLGILEHLGCRTKREDGALIVDPPSVSGSEIPDELMREMRSSVIFLGAVLAKTGRVRLSTPGGCEIGLRPIDIHIDGIKKLGASVSDTSGFIEISAPDGLKGANVTLSFPSVGATENLMIAASLADGTTHIVNAAREPEISDLADFLNGMGARISGAGEGTVSVEGVKSLHGTEHTVIPDRIVAGTLLSCAAITGGKIELKGLIPAHLGPMIDVFEQMGCDVKAKSDSLRLSAPETLSAVKTVRTMPYPGFPTDIQAPVTAALTRAKGTSVVIETIFESRFKYIGELVRFGAQIRTDGRMAVVQGVDRLFGTNAVTPDLRGGAALVAAALAADGTSRISEIRHIERGYQDLDMVLKGLNADIEKVTDEVDSSGQKQK